VSPGDGNGETGQPRKGPQRVAVKAVRARLRMVHAEHAQHHVLNLERGDRDGARPVSPRQERVVELRGAGRIERLDDLVRFDGPQGQGLDCIQTLPLQPMLVQAGCHAGHEQRALTVVEEDRHAIRAGQSPRRMDDLPQHGDGIVAAQHASRGVV
jgi:hypothetical protein